MRLTHALTIPTLTLALVGLTACSSGDDTEPSATPTPAAETPSAGAASATPTATATASEAAEPTDTADAAPAGDLTAPGTSVPTSEPLVLPLVEAWYEPDTDEYPEQDAPATYTFGGIRTGSPDDLASEFGDDDLATLEQFDIFYVDYTVSLDNGPLTEASHGIQEVTELEAIDSAGAPNAANFVFFDGGPDVCAYGDTIALATEGTTEACLIVAATKGETVATLEFTGDYESDYEGNPVEWVVE